MISWGNVRPNNLKAEKTPIFPLVTRAESDSLDGQWAIEGVGKDTVTRLDIVDEGVDRAG